MRFIARRLRAVLLLALFLGSPLPFGNEGHRVFADDAACDPGGLGASAPHLEVASVALAQTHCAICHLARTDSDARSPTVGTADLGFRHADLPPPVAPALVDAVRNRTQPSRAPPTLA